MTKKVDVSDRKLENFCIALLRRKGYIVHKLFEYSDKLNEPDIIKRFYYLNSQDNSSSVGKVIANGKADSVVFKKLMTKFEVSGLSYEHSLQYLADLIEYLFKDPVIFGGPFISFRIFSSEQFLEHLLFAFEKDRQTREDEEWEKSSLEMFKESRVDMADVVNSLVNLKESIENG